MWFGTIFGRFESKWKNFLNIKPPLGILNFSRLFKIPTRYSNLSFFRSWPPRWWRTWRWPPGRWWAWPPRLVGQIWSTNPYWLPCNCGKSIKPRELAGNISNFINLTRFFFCLTKMTLIQVLYSKDDISRSLPWPNKQKGPYKLECKGKFMSGYLKTKPLLYLLNLKFFLKD